MITMSFKGTLLIVLTVITFLSIIFSLLSNRKPTTGSSRSKYKEESQRFFEMLKEKHGEEKAKQIMDMRGHYTKENIVLSAKKDPRRWVYDSEKDQWELTEQDRPSYRYYAGK